MSIQKLHFQSDSCKSVDTGYSTDISDFTQTWVCVFTHTVMNMSRCGKKELLNWNKKKYVYFKLLGESLAGRR